MPQDSSSLFLQGNTKPAPLISKAQPDPAPTDKVRVRMKDGSVWAIPRDKLDIARQRGAVPAESLTPGITPSTPGAYQQYKGGPIQEAQPESWAASLRQIPPTILNAFGIDPTSEHGVTRQLIEGAARGAKSLATATAGEMGSPNLENYTPFGPLGAGARAAWKVAGEPLKQLMQTGTEEAIQGWRTGDKDSLVRGLTKVASAGSQLALAREAPETAEDIAELPKTGARGMLGLGKTGVRSAFRDLDQSIAAAKEANVTRTGQSFLSDLNTRMAGQMGDTVSTVRDNVRKAFDGRYDALRKDIGPRDTDFTPVDVAKASARTYLDNPALEAQFDRAMKNAGIPVSKEFLDTGEGTKPVSASTKTMPYGKAQEIYTQLGDELYGGSGPDYDKLSSAIQTVRKALGASLEAVADAAGQGDAFRQLRREYSQFKSAFDDKRAPLRQLIDADTSPARESILKKFGFDDTLAGLLSKYGSIGGNPELASQLRSVTRLIENSPAVQALKDIPKIPSVEDWRLSRLRRLSEMLTQPSKWDVSVIGSPTAPIRRILGNLLSHPGVEKWLTKD